MCCTCETYSSLMAIPLTSPAILSLSRKNLIPGGRALQGSGTRGSTEATKQGPFGPHVFLYRHVICLATAAIQKKYATEETRHRPCRTA